MANSKDRLDRIEAILLELAESQARTQASLERTAQIMSSNARMIEVNSNSPNDHQQEEWAKLQQRTQKTLAGIDDAVKTMTSEAQRNAQRHEEFCRFMRGLQTEIQQIWDQPMGSGADEA